MSIVKLSSLSLATLALSFACRHTNLESSHLKADETQESAKQVLIVLGGFMSCGSDNVHLANPLAGTNVPGLMHEVRAKASAGFASSPDRVFSTCYTIEFNKQMTLGDVEAFNTFMVDSANPKVVERLPPEQMMDKIISKLSEPELKNADVHIVGHSYGGWTAMKFLNQTVKKFPSGAEQPFKIKTFVTLDPISKVECKPKLIFDHLNGLVMESKSLPADITPAGCRRAPVDFNSDLKAMACRVAVWKNYYQTASGILASSSIGSEQKLPIINVDLMSIPTPRDPRAFVKSSVHPHIAFLTEDPVLEQVKSLIAEQSQKPFSLPNGCANY